MIIFKNIITQEINDLVYIWILLKKTERNNLLKI
jgi:hypothetical protein